MSAYAIQTNAYRTNDGHDPLPRLIGPFSTREAAETFMQAQCPLWGTWNIAPLSAPTTVGGKQ